jgi:hypothetical protein
MMCSTHDVRTSSLSQVVEPVYHRPVIDIEIKHLFILACMELTRDLGWNWFGLGAADFFAFVVSLLAPSQRYSTTRRERGACGL